MHEQLHHTYFGRKLNHKNNFTMGKKLVVKLLHLKNLIIVKKEKLVWMMDAIDFL